MRSEHFHTRLLDFDDKDNTQHTVTYDNNIWSVRKDRKFRFNQKVLA